MCESLEKVTMSQGLKSIGESAFSECRNLKRVEITSEVEVIEDAFDDDCEIIKIVVVKDPVEMKVESTSNEEMGLQQQDIINEIENDDPILF